VFAADTRGRLAAQGGNQGEKASLSLAVPVSHLRRCRPGAQSLCPGQALWL